MYLVLHWNKSFLLFLIWQKTEVNTNLINNQKTFALQNFGSLVHLPYKEVLKNLPINKTTSYPTTQGVTEDSNLSVIKNILYNFTVPKHSLWIRPCQQTITKQRFTFQYKIQNYCKIAKKYRKIKAVANRKTVNLWQLSELICIAIALEKFCSALDSLSRTQHRVSKIYLNMENFNTI